MILIKISMNLQAKYNVAVPEESGSMFRSLSVTCLHQYRILSTRAVVQEITSRKRGMNVTNRPQSLNLSTFFFVFLHLISHGAPPDPHPPFPCPSPTHPHPHSRLSRCSKVFPCAFFFFLTRQRGISAGGLLICSGSVHRARRGGRRGRKRKERWTLYSPT